MFTDFFWLPASIGITEIFSTFSSAFSSAFGIITDNPVLLVIVCASVGLPILGGVLAVVRGR